MPFKKIKQNKEKKKKKQKAQSVLHLNQTFIGFTNDLHTSDKSVAAISMLFCLAPMREAVKYENQISQGLIEQEAEKHNLSSMNFCFILQIL